MMGLIHRGNDNKQEYIPIAAAVFNKEGNNKVMTYNVIMLATSIQGWIMKTANADGLPFESRGASSQVLSSLREMAEVEHGYCGVIRLKCETRQLMTWYCHLGFRLDDARMTNAIVTEKEKQQYYLITPSKMLTLPSSVAGYRVVHSNHIDMRTCCKYKMMDYCIKNNGTMATETMIRYFSLYQERVPKDGPCHDENGDLYTIRCDACDEVMPGAPLTGLPTYITVFIMTHSKRCIVIRDALTKLEQQHGSIKKQFDSNEPFLNEMVLKYVKTIRDSSCTADCGDYTKFPAVNYRKRVFAVHKRDNTKDWVDGHEFEETKLYVLRNQGKYDTEQMDWDDVSSLARTDIPIVKMLGPHWYAKNRQGHVSNHLDDEVKTLFTIELINKCTRNRNQFEDVMKGKL
jgi:hypothetical protein